MSLTLSVNLFSDLARHHKNLYRGNPLYANFETLISRQLKLCHNESEAIFFLGEVGQINFPYFEMGNRNSSHLFGLDELIIFSFYFMNKSRYRNVLDLGANLGLHSLVLKKLGYEVTSYEPDSQHARQFRKVMKLNSFRDDGLFEKAVSTESGFTDFVRVLQNTTGSHLKGAKESYGPTELHRVEIVDIREVLNGQKFDLIKMDVEGHEADLITRLNVEDFEDSDIIFEIGSKKNAHVIFEFLSANDISLYTQKNQWNLVKDFSSIPTHHSEGSAFISKSGPPFLSQ